MNIRLTGQKEAFTAVRVTEGFAFETEADAITTQSLSHTHYVYPFSTRIERPFVI